MPNLTLFNYRRDQGIQRVCYRIATHISSNVTELENLFLQEEKAIKEVDPKKAFAIGIKFMNLVSEEGSELYEIGHNSDILEYRRLKQVSEETQRIENELNYIRQVEGIANVSSEVANLYAIEKGLEAYDSNILDFVRNTRRKWMTESRESTNVFTAFNAFSSERIAKSLKIIERKIFSEDDDYQRNYKDIAPELEKARKDLKTFLAKKGTVAQNEASKDLKDDLKKLKETYEKILNIAKEEQKELEEIYKIDFVLMHRLHESLEKFKKDHLSKLYSTGFGQLTKEDVISKELPKEVVAALDAGNSPMTILYSIESHVNEFLKKLNSKLSREEQVVIKSA